jgi:hypothetical protein
MQIPTFTHSCAQPEESCAGTCTGYESTCTCSPLIVLAVLATATPPVTLPAHPLQGATR